MSLGFPSLSAALIAPPGIKKVCCVPQKSVLILSHPEIEKNVRCPVPFRKSAGLWWVASSPGACLKLSKRPFFDSQKNHKSRYNNLYYSESNAKVRPVIISNFHLCPRRRSSCFFNLVPGTIKIYNNLWNLGPVSRGFRRVLSWNGNVGDGLRPCNPVLGSNSHAFPPSFSHNFRYRMD